LSASTVLRVVVDAAQQHHLIADREAGVGEAIERDRGLGGALARVVEVGVDEDRVVRAQGRRAAPP
jgi:hypothetical protein